MSRQDGTRCRQWNKVICWILQIDFLLFLRAITPCDFSFYASGCLRVPLYLWVCLSMRVSCCECIILEWFFLSLSVCLWLCLSFSICMPASLPPSLSFPLSPTLSRHTSVVHLACFNWFNLDPLKNPFIWIYATGSYSLFKQDTPALYM